MKLGRKFAMTVVTLVILVGSFLLLLFMKKMTDTICIAFFAAVTATPTAYGFINVAQKKGGGTSVAPA